MPHKDASGPATLAPSSQVTGQYLRMDVLTITVIQD